jgi:hypothetical protein
MMRNRGIWSPISLLACVAATSCTGTLRDNGGRGTASGQGPDSSGGTANGQNPNSAGSGADLGDGTGPGALPPGINPGGMTLDCGASLEPGVTPLLKLSTRQYRNTVRDLLTAAGAPEVLAAVEPHLASVPDDSLGDSFRGLDNRISLEHVQSYLNTATGVGDAVLGSPALLSVLAGECAGAASLSEACVSNFLGSFVQLAYRRPLTEEEALDYQSLNNGTRTPAEAIRAIIVVALTSPRFVNHLQIDGTAIGGSADLLQLTAYEIANRLSYTFWQTMPDAELLAAAADGSLATEQGFALQLNRVFQDGRAKDTLWQFWDEWLRLEKFTGFETARPGFQSLAAGEPVGEPGHDYYGDMVQELRDLTELFTYDRSATLADLLATNVSVTKSTDLARLYGVAPYDGSGNYPVVPAGTRAGILQRGALLASNLEQTNPFHRGAVVRRHLLCDPLPQPDPNALPPGSLDPPPPSAAQTTRQRFEAKVDGNALCSGCHSQFSDIGYVMEAFDSLGRYRTVERVFDEQTGEQLAELPIDATAVVYITANDNRPVSGPAELNERLIESAKVEACMANHFFEFASRRTREPNSLDTCAIQDMKASFQDQKLGLAGAFQRIARYSSFFVRKVGPR